MSTADDVASVYWSTFAGAPRHAIHIGGHWTPQHGEPATEIVVAALTGDGPPLSTFFLDNQSSTHVLAIDIDATDGWSTIEAITKAFVGVGVTAYPEHSRRGGHIWVIVDHVIPAIVGRMALMAVIEHAGFDTTDKRLELRPNTDRHGSDFAGGSLRTPWMRHPETGERFGLLDPRTFLPLHDKVGGALLDLELASAAVLGDLAQGYVPPRMASQPREKGHEPGSITSVLRQRFGTHDANSRPIEPGKSIVCPFHDDTHPSMKIAVDDRRAWCHSPRCEAHENGRGITAWQAARLAGAA